ncbi:hypothetical protein [Acanthopleuribacter pedis]|uniref:Uncharacterized protein n=1 Tax=Acanthopleuribacter pedis TaxID=442870 RepID=A0A8J7QKB9_9BACT|nr:hypothetical protein [Acanthopleuribacter pedis]MBO1321545.1 hypothetical protein [Acanthopleuribacter pedis]
MNTPKLKGHTLSDEPQHHEHLQCAFQITVAPNHQVTISVHLDCESREHEIKAADLFLAQTSRDIVIDIIETHPLVPTADFNPNELSGEYTIPGDRFSAGEDDDHSFFVIVAGSLVTDAAPFVFHRRLELG